MPAPCWPLAERAREDLRSLRETPAGKVSVGLPPRIARVLTPPLVQAFRREFPGASIAVAEGLSAQVREWLLAGRVDLALLYDPAPHLSWPASRCSAKTWCWPPPPALGPRCPHASRSGPGRLSAGAAQPAQRHPHTGRQRLPRPGRAPAGGGRGRRGADHRRAGRAGRCLRHPATLSRPGTGGRARAGAGRYRRPRIVNNLVLATARHRPSTRLASATAKLIRGLELRALFAPAKALKCPLRFLVWRLAAVKVPLASHLKQ